MNNFIIPTIVTLVDDSDTQIEIEPESSSKSNQSFTEPKKRSNSLQFNDKYDFIRIYNCLSLSCPNFGSYQLYPLVDKTSKKELKQNINTFLSDNTYLSLRHTNKSQSRISLMKTPNGSVFDLSIYGDNPSDLQELDDVLKVNLNFDSYKQKCKNWLKNFF